MNFYTTLCGVNRDYRSHEYKSQRWFGRSNFDVFWGGINVIVKKTALFY